VQVALGVVHEVGEEAERGALGLGIASCLATHDVGSARGVQLGDHPRVREAGQGDRGAQRLEGDEHGGGRQERHDMRDRGQRPERAPPPEMAGVDAPSPGDGRGLGEDRRAGVQETTWGPASGGHYDVRS
jgi:hypothetical protein